YEGDMPDSAPTDGTDPGYGFAYEEDQVPENPAKDALLPVKSYCCIEPFKLQLCCVNRSDGLSLEFLYDTRCYSREDIQRLTQHYKVLLNSALQNPDAPIGSLNLLSQAQRRQLLVEWNRTQEEFAPVEAVHHLFEQQVALTPDAPALVFEE